MKQVTGMMIVNRVEPGSEICFDDEVEMTIDKYLCGVYTIKFHSTSHIDDRNYLDCTCAVEKKHLKRIKKMIDKVLKEDD